MTSPGPKKVIRPLERGSPGDGLPLVDVHPSFDLATVRPEGFEPKVGGIAWLPDGRMLLSTWDADGSVWILDGVRGDDRSKITVKRFAAGLAKGFGLTEAVRAAKDYITGAIAAADRLSVGTGDGPVHHFYRWW